VLYPRKCFQILQFYICLAVLYKIISLSFSYAFFCLFFYFMYLWLVRFPQSVLHDILLLKILRVHVPETPAVPTPLISDDCNQTWPGSGTRGYAGFGLFKRPWQTRGLENMMPLWPMLSCVIRHRRSQGGLGVFRTYSIFCALRNGIPNKIMLFA